MVDYAEKLTREESYKSESYAFKLLDYFCKDEAEKVRALHRGIEALALKEKLWNYALAEITKF